MRRGVVTREALVSAGRRLFAEHGYDDTSIEAVLSSSGVARGGLYHHFASKHELFDAVLEREIVRISEASATAASAALRASGDAVQALLAGCRTWLEEVAKDAGVQRILLVDATAVVGWRRVRQLDEAHTLGGLVRTMEELAAGGRIDSRQVRPMAHLVLAAVAEAALVIAQAGEPREAADDVWSAVRTLLERSLGPSGGVAGGPAE